MNLVQDSDAVRAQPDSAAAAHRAIIYQPPSTLRPYERNARKHSKKQLRQIADSITRFGFTLPVLINADSQILAGHGRVEAAKLLNMEAVPTIALAHLSEAEQRAYVIADNKLALNADWDKQLLASELEALIDLDFEIELTGFEMVEVDLIIDSAKEASPEPDRSPDDDVPIINGPAVTQLSDVWLLDRHRLICGDALDQNVFEKLMDGERAHMAFTDPPYNVPIDGHVCGLGSTKHREFAYASGKMSEEQFTAFLEKSLGNLAQHLVDGAIAFACMDWRHITELNQAGRKVFADLKNLIVWNKTNGGMGTFYRSKHELIFAFKYGQAPHRNNFGLGDKGRYRTNVWDYPGISAISATRADELAMHPTVKPVALVVDAIKDCSHRGEIILDPFGGSGTTLIAAEKTGRVARVIEIDPLYCDTIIKRWQKLTGKQAMLAATGASFEVVDERLGVAPQPINLPTKTLPALPPVPTSLQRETDNG